MALGAAERAVFRFFGQSKHGGFTVLAAYGFEQAVSLLLELDAGQAMTMLTLIYLVVNFTLIDTVALKQVNLPETAGARGLIDTAHDDLCDRV